MKWFKKCVTTDYANFNGRARREEYWMFVLFNMIIATALGFVLGLLSLPDWLAYIYSLAIVVPNIAVSVRRLHDIGKSGLWCLIGFIPLIGAIWLLILFCKDSEPGANKYGENPKGL
jgi:uncharacterized membrane protein YhaH (DUF805 family)